MAGLHCVLGPTLPPSDANHPLHCDRGLARDVEKEYIVLIDLLVRIGCSKVDMRPTFCLRVRRLVPKWLEAQLSLDQQCGVLARSVHFCRSQALTSRLYIVQHKITPKSG